MLQKPKSSWKKIFYRFCWPPFFISKKMGWLFYRAGLRYEFRKDWSSRPTPEWFDHEFDLAFFPEWRKPHFFERGVYLQEVLRPNDSVLDLCCGEGSVSALFIAPSAQRVVGVDFDETAIARARRKYSHFVNLEFQRADIRELSFAPASFDLVSWDAAIAHFTKPEMDRIFGSIRTVLKGAGILAGSTVAQMDHQQHFYHEYEFRTLTELSTFLLGYFPHVQVWERKHPGRTNFYFRCSGEALPAMKGGL